MTGRISAITAVALLAGGWWYLSRLAGKNDSALDMAEVQANLAAAYFGGDEIVNMQLSEAGLLRIAVRERFSATRYRDADGYSIGYGHFIQAGEEFAEPMTRETAQKLLRDDAETAADAVRAYVKVALTQSQFDALVSLVYNVGAGAFRRSHCLTKLNAGDYTGAMEEMAGFKWSQGVVSPVLVARRADEIRQFFA